MTIPVTVTANIASSAKVTVTSAQGLGTTFKGAPNANFTETLNSTDVAKVSFNTYTVGVSATTIDVTSLTDPFGNPISFTVVKELYIRNKDSTNNLSVGGGVNPLFSALPSLVGQTTNGGSVGSCAHLTTQITVSGGTKNIALTASASTIQVDVLLVGS